MYIIDNKKHSTEKQHNSGSSYFILCNKVILFFILYKNIIKKSLKTECYSMLR